MNNLKTISDNIKSLLAAFVTIMTYVIFLVVLFRYSTDNNAVSQVIIAVVGAFSAVSGYYFGYSQGASKKDDVIAAQSSQPLATTDSGDINLKK